MTNMLRDGVSYLHGQRQKRMASKVTYQRGVDSVELKATRGETNVQEATGDGQVISTEADWLINPNDLVLFGSETRPQRGDTITDVHNGVTKVYVVMPTVAEDVWRYSDPYGECIRVHTKRVSES